MQPFVRNMLTRQRKRALAIIMGHAERSFYDRLTVEQQTEFRKAVLGAVSSYHEACIDLVESSVNDGMMLNDDAVRLMAELNENLQRERDLRVV
jgi:hypothetical protein